ncbi:hypothetical protein BDV96DRAFT_320236 [Lophiotrema nucula]|uniref:Uncharacterized protein n=1 Tax=Lophiotrema nucula TaxID=690887 RepID=A0A6A5ZMG1_9PLEO|nr:hypothetical protein BDV96DRAFT_320236 [Lophiotrema nucula]
MIFLSRTRQHKCASTPQFCIVTSLKLRVCSNCAVILQQCWYQGVSIPSRSNSGGYLSTIRWEHITHLVEKCPFQGTTFRCPWRANIQPHRICRRADQSEFGQDNFHHVSCGQFNDLFAERLHIEACCIRSPLFSREEGDNARDLHSHGLGRTPKR